MKYLEHYYFYFIHFFNENLFLTKKGIPFRKTTT